MCYKELWAASYLHRLRRTGFDICTVYNSIENALSMGEDEIQKSYDRDSKDYKVLFNKI